MSSDYVILRHVDIQRLLTPEAATEMYALIDSINLSKALHQLNPDTPKEPTLKVVEIKDV